MIILLINYVAHAELFLLLHPLALLSQLWVMQCDRAKTGRLNATAQDDVQSVGYER